MINTFQTTADENTRKLLKFAGKSGKTLEEAYNAAPRAVKRYPVSYYQAQSNKLIDSNTVIGKISI